jgi:L-seryl-tRNA(Ser) seleniumtransferase
MNSVKANNKRELLRSIPSVGKIIERDDVKALLREYSRGFVLKAIQRKLENVRRNILNAQEPLSDKEPITVDFSGDEIKEIIKSFSNNHLKKVINATGVILHTNLGRSILPVEAIDNLRDIAHSYSNLEYDLEEGRRGHRYSHVEELLCEISGAESAFVVNNNAGAVLLTLNALADGKEAIVSRGELIEIGGSFRIPDIMKRSGALMVEVGTTNKTHLSDYEKAISEKTGILLKVHTSNYRIVGFTSEVDLSELIELGEKHNLPILNDLGSGSLIDFSLYGIAHEPTAQDVVKTGIDVVTFSGDKLLGGPQAGIILGKRNILDKLIKNPLNRALRIDKLTLVALESTLRLYLDQETVIQKIPTLRMITLPLETIEKRAFDFKRKLQENIPDHIMVQIIDDTSQVGGGALPSQELPTKVIAIASKAISVQDLEKRLRENKPPIITRINKDQLRIDLRTVDESEEEYLIASIASL